MKTPETETKREAGKALDGKKGENSKPEKGKGKKPKKHLHQVITTQAHDGTFSHEHIYKDKKEDMHSHPPVFAGTSSDMDDLHQHMDDHFGPQTGGGEEPEAEGAPEEGAEQEPEAE